MQDDKPRALILGITGQDGAFLSKILLDNGYIVFGLTRSNTNNNLKKLRWIGTVEQITLIERSAYDIQDMIDIIDQYQPNYIFNLAGLSSVAESFDRPLDTFYSITKLNHVVLEAIRLTYKDITYVNCASGDCFGNVGGNGAVEDTDFNPQSPYAYAKCNAAETTKMYRTLYGVRGYNAFLFNHESELREQNFVTQKIITAAINIKNGKQNKLTLSNPFVVRDWGFAPEFADALKRISLYPEATDFVIATGTSQTLYQFANSVFSHANLELEEFLEINGTVKRRADVIESSGCPSKARELLNWHPIVYGEKLGPTLYERRVALSNFLSKTK